MQNMCGDTKNICKGQHHKAMPVLVILFGLTFLLGAMNILSPDTVMMIWPVLVIIAGVKKLMMGMGMGMCKCC